MNQLLCILLSFTCSVGAQEIQDLTIAWDASLSMNKRDFIREKEFLGHYFEEHPQAAVTLLLFSNTVWASEHYQVVSGDWTALAKRLETVPYDGATSYRDLPEYCSGAETLLFTDGQQNGDDATPVFNGNLCIINSSESYNPANLNLLAILNEGELVNFKSRPEVKPAGHDERETFCGRIHGAFTDPEAVHIRVKGKEAEGVRPDPDGNYAIEARPGEVLEFVLDGRQSVQKTLGGHRNIDVWLEEGGGIRLDEVVITEKATAERVETTTAYGTKNQDAVGYAVETITQKDISEVASTAANATQGKFSGVSLGQNNDLSQVEIRPKTSILSNNYGLIVIDGVPMSKSNSSAYNSTSPVQNTGFIDPKNIASITVLRGLAATNRFGSLGANGAILITTKAASFGKTGKKKDLALRTDNIYDGKISVNAKALTTDYLKALKKGTNVGEAYAIYLEQRESYWDQTTYFLDLFEYFREASPELALRIASNILERERPSLMELKGLLYKARELGKDSLEMQTARKILDVYPGKIQSYFDMALARKHQGNHQEALNLLLGITSGTANPQLDFSGLEKSAGRELRNLVYHCGDALDLSQLPPEYRNNIRYNARLIFDWNNPDAQFELKFVNPQKRFFTWEHTNLAIGKRIRNELELGYGLEEFEIFGEGVAGNWLINVKYLGNMNSSDTTPVFLRCRVEYNFGKPDQRGEEHVIRLHEKGSEAQIVQLRVD